MLTSDATSTSAATITQFRAGGTVVRRDPRRVLLQSASGWRRRGVGAKDEEGNVAAGRKNGDDKRLPKASIPEEQDERRDGGGSDEGELGRLEEERKEDHEEDANGQGDAMVPRLLAQHPQQDQPQHESDRSGYKRQERRWH